MGGFIDVFQSSHSAHTASRIVPNHYRILMRVEKESKQIFASKYKLYLPTEKELRKELLEERKRIELYQQR